MSKNNDHKSIEKITTTLGKETSFNGVLRFKESLKIDGTFEGEIESPGFLYIENGATVKANIRQHNNTAHFVPQARFDRVIGVPPFKVLRPLLCLWRD